jgi:hypothetical protein
MQTSVKVTTGGSDIVMWTDSDNDGYGAQYYEGSNVFTSNGGNITYGGGLDDGGAANTELTGRTAGDGIPDGYAAGNTGWGQNSGLDFVGAYQVLSGGGDISMAGRGSVESTDNDWGITLRGGMVFSGTGKIAMYGKSPASCSINSHRGIVTGYGGETFIISNNTGARAIYLYGNTASCNNGGSVYANAIEGWTSYTRVATPAGGDVEIYGIQGSASYVVGTWGNDYEESNILALNYWDVLSQNGDIKLVAEKATTSATWGIRFATRSGVNSQVGGNSGAITTNYTAYPTIAAFTNSGDITMTGDAFCGYYTYLRSTGNLVIEPFGADFSNKNFLSTTYATYFPTVYKSVRIGKPGTSGATQSKQDIELDRVTSSGDISIYGGTINLRGGLTTSATTGNGILVKASADIVVDSGTSAVRNPLSVTGTSSTAPVTIWSNADATGGGAISIGNYVDVLTQGADIVFGGSAAATDISPTSHADGVNAGTCDGIRLGASAVANGSVAIASNGGNITLRGKNTLNAGSCLGLKAFSGLAINSGAGAILMDGVSVAPSGTGGGKIPSSKSEPASKPEISHEPAG